MGDVPALFLFVASLHFFKTGMDQKRTMYLLAGAVVQAVGFFVRQTSIIFLGIISLYLLIKKEISVRQWLSSFVLPVAGMLVVYGVLWRMGAVPGKIGARFLPEGWSYITQIIFNSWHLGLLVSVIALLLAEVLRRFSWSKGAFIAVLAVFVAYALVGTHNYLAWNDARWQLGRRLLATGTPVEQIEGGYEWNGWFLYLKTRQSPLGSFTAEWAPWYVKELSPGHGMEYIIAFSPLGGYRVVDIQKVDSVGYDQKKFIYLNRIMPGSLK